MPDHLAYPFIKLGAKIYGNFDLEEITAADAVKHAKLPILLIHGEADRFVPCNMSREIRDACASYVQLCTFDNAGHGLCYMSNPIRYETETVHFLSGIPELRPFLAQSEDFRKVLDTDG